MSRELLIARARRAAERGMRDACTIRRLTGETTDDDSGEVATTWQDLYAGKCRVQQSARGAQAAGTTVAEDYVRLLALEVQLPMSVTGLTDDDEITITASVSDPDLPGRVFLIKGLAHKTDATARRVQVTERTS